MDIIPLNRISLYLRCVCDIDHMYTLRIHNTSEEIANIFHLSAVHSWSPSYPYNGCKLNSLLTYHQQGFIAQLVEHRTGIAEVIGLNPVGASYFFLGCLCNCFSCFTIARITSGRILYKWKWSSQLWSNLKQLQIKPRKISEASTGFRWSLRIISGLYMQLVIKVIS